MKKIVAVVLSLVMVLGLATTAFAAKTTTYEGLYAKDTNTLTETAGVSIEIVPAVAPKYNTDGTLKTPGKVEEVLVSMEMMPGVTVTDTYFFVNTLAEADLVLCKDEACKQVLFYVAELEVASANYKEGVLFTNFGEDCGEVYYEADADLKYFTIKGEAPAVYEENEDGDVVVMYAGKVYNVAAINVGATAHTPVFETKNGKVVSIECGECDAVAVEAANAMSIPKLADTTNLPANWYWAAASAPAASDKVESAQTFDAGIAMYVGMSVMAAAGSAVVLKKKD